MRDEIKRAALCLLVLIICIVGVLALRARFFRIMASADITLPAEDYPDFGMVVDLIDDYDLAVIQTRDGNQWVIIGEDWFVGDCCCLVFNDSGTRYDRSDDWIVSIRYVAMDDYYVPSYFRDLIAYV